MSSPEAGREPRPASDEPERVVITDKRKVRADGTAAPAPEPGAGAPDATAPADGPGTPDAEPAPDENATLLAERTADLQRLQAEYANYRRRAERERAAAGDAALAKALGEFLPVLDDLERARAHGDLTGGLKAVADKLDGVFASLGLEAFGAVGDPFDPAVHDAVMHDESDEVTVATCTTVMRPGYRHRERLLRPAMVGVSDPAGPTAPDADPSTDAASAPGRPG